MHPRFPLSVAGFAAIGFLAATVATSAQQPMSRARAEELLARSIGPGLDLSRFLEQSRAEFQRADADGDGVVTPADRERVRAQDMALARAAAIQEMLAADLDGDGTVTRDEVVAVENSRLAMLTPGETEAAAHARAEAAIATRMRADRDGDGRIDPAEILAYAAERAARAPLSSQPMIEVALAFDDDGDGRTTLSEYLSAAERLFRALDADDNGIVSREEIDAYRRRLAPPPPVARPAPPDARQLRETECAMPAVPEGAKIALVGTYRGLGVSTIALGSQDANTTVAHVTIEAGVEPLYVVLAAYEPIIWQFDGATERVVRLVLASNAPGHPNPVSGIAAGVTGLPAEIVAFAPRTDCLKHFTEVPSVDSTLAVGSVRRRTGREADMVVAFPGTEHVWLPSGRHERSRESRDSIAIQRSGVPVSEASLRADLAQESPAGIVSMDPATVVAGQQAERYDVLPGTAGLLQLLQEGRIEPGHGQEFIVRAKIHYPAQLAGSNAVRFRIPAGVPRPDGDAGASCVMFEDGTPSQSCR